LDDRDFTTALYNRGIQLTHLGEVERAIEVSRELFKLELLTDRLIMVAEMLTS
jgi:hypothetical protein